VKRRAVLFDLDGTLLDTIEDLADSMNCVLGRFGFGLHDIETYKYFVGAGVEELVRKALPNDGRITGSVYEACLALMREEYGRRWKDKTRPYDGIADLLDELAQRKVKLAILSNKPHDATLRVVSELLPSWSFDAVLGARPSIPKKPDPLSALEIAEAIQIQPGEFLYLGDTDIDMKTANAAGMYAVGASWGFRRADELIAGGAKTVIEKPVELIELL
jgi:phosphoglycolate phosphatase